MRTALLDQGRELVLVDGGVGAVLLVLGRRADQTIAEDGAADHDALGALARHRQDRGADEARGRLVEDDELALARRDSERRGPRDRLDEIAVVAGGVDDDARLDRPAVRRQTPAPRRAIAAGDLGVAADRAAMGEALQHVGQRRRPGIDDVLARNDARPPSAPARRCGSRRRSSCRVDEMNIGRRRCDGPASTMRRQPAPPPPRSRPRAARRFRAAAGSSCSWISRYSA